MVSNYLRGNAKIADACGESVFECRNDEALKAAAELDRLRAGIQRIADGYGGDVESFARNLLDGNA